MTAVVNLSVYFVLNRAFSVNYFTSNLVAWVVTVTFAYAANKLLVFRTRCRSLRGLLREMLLFVNSRLFSGVVEQMMMWQMAGVCCLNSSMVKMGSSAVAVMINYLVSRTVFKVKINNGAVRHEYSDIREKQVL